MWSIAGGVRKRGTRGGGGIALVTIARAGDELYCENMLSGGGIGGRASEGLDPTFKGGTRGGCQRGMPEGDVSG